MIDRSPLDDPHTARHAFARLKRRMWQMAAVTLVVIAVAMAIIYAMNGLASIHLYIATALGVGMAMLLTGALMGLVFLSNGTGHDAAVKNSGLDDSHDQWDTGRNR